MIEIKRVAYSRRLIIEWAVEGLSPAQIAAKLNEQGLRTLQGRPWSREKVWQAIKNAKMRQLTEAHPA